MRIGKLGEQNSDPHIWAVNQRIAHKHEAITGKNQEEKRI